MKARVPTPAFPRGRDARARDRDAAGLAARILGAMLPALRRRGQEGR